MKLRLRRPRIFARTLWAAARTRPDEVEHYLDTHTEEWEALAEATPEDAADILEELDEEAAGDLLADLEPEDAAEVLEEINPGHAADIVEELPTATVVEVLEELEPEDAADILAEVDRETRELLLEAMTPEAADDIRDILEYEPDSAGGLMTTDVAALPVGMTAGEAIERIRQLHEELEELSYVYVVDDGGRLVGVISFRDLVFARPGAGLDEVMVPNPVAVTPDTDREEVAELAQRYHLFAVPVVDDDRRLLGIVTADAVIEAVQQEASEDFAAAMGAGIEETIRTPVRHSIRARLPWIAFDVAISSTVVVAISRFADVLDEFVVLAALMPLVARIGGDAGAQSLAVVIRSLAAGDVPGQAARRVISRETIIGLANGAAIGLLAGLLGYTMQAIQGEPDPVRIGVAMFLAGWANLTIAGLAGAGIPLALRRIGFDPALGSNLFLTTVTDLLGFAGFLAVAEAILRR